MLAHRPGRDFSTVHIHADRAAAEYTSRLGARAVTVGSELYFKDLSSALGITAPVKTAPATRAP